MRAHARAVVLVILGWDLRCDNFPSPEYLLDFENLTDEDIPDGTKVLSEGAYFQTAVDVGQSTTKDRTDYLGQGFPVNRLARGAGARAALLAADGEVQEVVFKTALLLLTMAPSAIP